MGVFTSDVCVSHDTGWFCPESPKRLEKLLADLRNEWQAEFFDSLQIFQPEVDVTLEQLKRVHSDEHLRTLESAFDRAGGFLTPTVNLDGDTVVSPGTRAACWRAAGLTVSAVDEVLSSTSSIRRAFVMVRPPGHHAEPTGAMGFCLLNHAMIGVAHAQAVHGLGKVAVLDFDVHMGNGCAAACWSDPTRLYASSHQAGIFPVGFSRYAPDGSGRAGEYSTILSCALPSGSGSAEFRSAWESQLLPAVREFAPECIFLNAGFDAHAQEDVASLALEDDDYYWITGVLFRSRGTGQLFPHPRLVDARWSLGHDSQESFFDFLCSCSSSPYSNLDLTIFSCSPSAPLEQVASLGLPIISVLEGGYKLDVLSRGVRSHVEALVRAQ